MWAVNSAGALNAIPVVPGATPTLGTPVAMSNSGWGGNQVAVENAYTPFDNTSTRTNGAAFTSGTGFDDYNYSYSSQGIQTAASSKGNLGFTKGGAIDGTSNSSGMYTDPSGAETASALAPDTVIATNDGFQFTWPAQNPGAHDDYEADGQTIPMPISYTDAAATRISPCSAQPPASPRAPPEPSLSGATCTTAIRPTSSPARSATSRCSTAL